MRREQLLKRIFERTRSIWDQPHEREAVRRSFQKVCECRTPALGGEIYTSCSERKIFYHTCKSKCCPSCGNRATKLWQREQWATLPDVPFVGVVLTMPDVFWPVFQSHRRMQHDLPALGAAAIQGWAWRRYRVRLFVVVVQHTFSGHLNYNPHLHMMVSVGGLEVSKAQWRQRLQFEHESIMSHWRLAVTSYLHLASKKGVVSLSSPSPEQFRDSVAAQAQRRWNIHITPHMSKRQFLGYAGRYIRRLPISQHRILSVEEDRVIYQTKDTRTKSLRENTCTPADFVGLLTQHVADRYKHSMRYFGLLAPRTKCLTASGLHLHLGQGTVIRPPRLSWQRSLIRDFGVDPLIDLRGSPMKWSGRIPPKVDRKAAGSAPRSSLD